MNNQEFAEKLAEKRGIPLYGDWLTKYQHIERLGNPEVEGLLDGRVTIQTKMDGANLSVAYANDTGIIIASRNNIVYADEVTFFNFNGAVDYILGHSGILTLARDFILRGEWLTRHSITYDAEHMKQFWVFDVQGRGTDKYFTPDEYIPLLEKHNIKFIPVLAELVNPTVEQLVPYTEGPDEFGARQKEGIVVKRYTFKNKFGRVRWGKLVSADFREKNKMVFGPCKHDPVEMRFAGEYVTEELVLKTINKIKDDNGGVITVKNMSEVLGRVWYDAFNEELWDFVIKKKVRGFDFYTARQLVTKATREIALAYFNGTLAA